jgi:choline dehydrogenase-like flavoprotein
MLIDGPARLTCDVLVIGSGAGGATVAATLAEAGVDVLMLEEGDHIPLQGAPKRLAPAMLAMWRNGGLLTTLGGSQIAFAEGRCVGGTTEINSAIFQRAPDAVIESWAAAQRLGDFSPASLAPYYERAARAVTVSPTPPPFGPPTDILVHAGAAMGWKTTPLERAQKPDRSRQSMSATFIPRALAKGARLIARCRARHLTMQGRRATGAIANAMDASGKRHRVTISANSIFICGGTIQTPALLQRSGIAGTAGRSFQLHPTVRVLARFPERVDAQRHSFALAAITEFMPEMRFGGSVFTLSSFGMALAEDWPRRSRLLPDYPHYAMYYAMIRPQGAGRVWTIPALRDPVVTYRLTDRDWRKLGEGCAKLSRALLAAGAESVLPSMRGHPGWTQANAPRDDLTLPRNSTSLMSIHLFGSCAIGECADTHGRLKTADNVIVADGSMLPGAPGVNPQATIMALSLRAADAFLARR